MQHYSYGLWQFPVEHIFHHSEVLHCFQDDHFDFCSVTWPQSSMSSKCKCTTAPNIHM